MGDMWGRRKDAEVVPTEVAVRGTGRGMKVGAALGAVLAVLFILFESGGFSLRNTLGTLMMGVGAGVALGGRWTHQRYRMISYPERPESKWAVAGLILGAAAVGFAVMIAGAFVAGITGSP